MHVIIQAGGKGTRLEGLTRNRPKCMVPVNNKPLIFWAFEAFKDSDITVICDYKKDAFERYIQAFGEVYDVRVIEADGQGTVSGISEAISTYGDDEPICVVWCDLMFSPEFKLPSSININDVKSNYVGLSGTFQCRWSFINSKFVHAPSRSTGVAGFFLFKNKSELKGLPKNGALVPWLQENRILFEPFYLQDVIEVGTVKVFEELTKPAICRPFNEVIISAETVTKRGIDDQGKNIAKDEVNWYRKVQSLGYKAIPKIFSYEPLIMERLKGKNIWQYSCLTISEKKEILNNIVINLNELHNLVPAIPAVKSDLDETYINKTFKRLEKIQNLVPFARDEFIRINGRWYRNVFKDKDIFKDILESYYPARFHLIHGDCTFSNMIYDRIQCKVSLLDPRGYFGKSKLFGDKDYDWAKVYYSLNGDYDQFNQKKFSLNICDKEVELAIQSNNWSDMEDYFFEIIADIKPTKIRALHALIWLSLTTYAWEDYDSICGAFYNGIIKSAEFV